MALLAGILFWQVQQLISALEWVDHSDVVLQHSRLFSRNMVDMEAAMFGYLSTGNENRLDNYRAGHNEVEAERQVLERLIADDPVERQKLASIYLAYKEWQQTAADITQSYSLQKSAISLELYSREQNLMEKIRQLQQKFTDTEDKLKLIRAGRAQRIRHIAAATAAGLAVVIALILVLATTRQVRMLTDSFTAARRAEQARRESETRLQQQAALLNLAHDAILVRDLGGKILFWNHGAEVTYGWPADEVLGQAIHEVLATRFPVPFEKIEAAVREHGKWEGDLTQMTHNGNPIVVASRWSVQQDENGAPVAILEINRDITEQKRAREDLQTASLYTRTLIEASLDPLVTISKEGTITDVNQATEVATGIDRHSMIASDFCEYFSEPEKARQGYQRVFSEGFVRDYPLAIRHTSGRLTHVLYNATVFKNESGEVEGVFAAARDVTDRMRAEQEVLKLNRELEDRVNTRTAELTAVNRELEAFNYAVAHDLRAPLRHIHGFAEILSEEAAGVLDEPAKRHLGMIRDSVQHMEQLLNDLLSLSRLGRQELSKQVCGLNAVVEEVVNALRPEIKDRQVEWHITELPFLECDPGLIKQVMSNLLSNALKFTRPRQPAVIEIGQQTVNGEPVVSVRDNGVGFSMAYVDKLFGLFQRLHRQQDFEGTGVGLAIVQRIINKHGGKVWAEGEPNKGATFYFTLHSSALEPGAQAARQELTSIAS